MNPSYLHLSDRNIAQIQEEIPNEIVIDAVSGLFKVFADATRVRILFVLFERELCVCDIAKSVSMSQSAVSHQLRILKQSRLVKYRRSGKEVIYALADDHIKTIFRQGLDHIEEYYETHL